MQCEDGGKNRHSSSYLQLRHTPGPRGIQVLARYMVLVWFRTCLCLLPAACLLRDSRFELRASGIDLRASGIELRASRFELRAWTFGHRALSSSNSCAVECVRMGVVFKWQWNRERRYFTYGAFIAMVTHREGAVMWASSACPVVCCWCPLEPG